MEEPKPPPPEENAETDRERRIANIVLLGFFVVVVGIGVWLANAMITHRQIDDCLAQGRRDCGRIEVPAR